MVGLVVDRNVVQEFVALVLEMSYEQELMVFVSYVER